MFKLFAKMATKENAFLNKKYFVSADSRQIVNNSVEYSNVLDNKNENIFYQSGEFQRNEIFYNLRKWFLLPKNCFSGFLILVFIVILFSNLDYIDAHGIGILKGLCFLLLF